MVIFLLFSIVNISTLKAATSLGSGSGSNNKLIGGDLTDPEDNGVDGSEDLKAGFDISKNINSFDLKFNANHSLSENSDQAANISLSRSF